ncbi:MAG TPA: dTDP-4-dehydrorhamnose reductase [Mycobacteriales bacterium]|nr:dTDP-4-dehydrorhamnose reductase [Mycobacteriales bacterium]
MSGWLVTGAGGQLGSDVVDLLHAYAEQCVGVARAELDITARDDVQRVIDDVRPDVVVNCAAYTDVDGAETDEDGAYAVNARGPQHLAEACAATGARLVHVSTDYVFAGDASTPYDEQTRPAPRTAYGRSKAAGEQAVLTSHADAFVVRTAWLYGAAGPNFVKTMARLSTQRDSLDVVDDQLGCPTWTLHLARGLIALAVSDEQPGIWHCTNDGEASWYVFARAVFAELGLDPARVQPTTTDKFPRPAPRPAYSVLSTAKWKAAGLPVMSHWRDALHEAFETLTDELTGA